MTRKGQSLHHAGARWIRAALQVNPFDYVGASAPKSKYPNEAAYNKALLDKCNAEGIELIAVTDHWSIDTSMGLIGDAALRGIVALPGFEANSSEGVHLLVIFEAGTKAGVINAAIGKCGGPPLRGRTTGASYDVILNEMADMGALVIPAHANVAKSGLLTSRAGDPLVEKIHHRHLHAIGITPSASEAPAQQEIFRRRKPYDRLHPIAKIHADDVCHADTLSDPGATTWFKVSTPCLASIKHAVLIPATRVKVFDPAPTPRATLREVSWTGGFLDGVKVCFSEDLTNLIGGRGTGKSTIIESLRYVLGIEPLGGVASSDHQAIIKDVLGSGATIELVVDAVSPTVGQYKIQRTVFGQIIVLDSSDTPTNLKPEDVVGSVDIYGQHELAELAQDKSSVADMLRRFSPPSDAEGEREGLLSKLAENRRKIDRAEIALAKLEGEVSDITRLEAQVARFKDTDVEKRLKELKRLRQDEAVLKAADDRIDGADTFLEELSVDEVIATLRGDVDLIKGSSEEATLRRAEKASKDLATAIEEAAKTIDAAVDAARTEIAAARSLWEKATSKKKAAHDEVLRELRDEGAEPEKYLATVEALEALRVKAQQIPTSEAAIKVLVKERAGLLKELALNGAAMSKDLVSMIRIANKATSDAVRVQSVQSPRRDDLEALVVKLIPGQRTQILSAIYDDSFSVPAFVAAVRTGSDELEKQFYIKGAQSAALIAAGEKFLREFEEKTVSQAVDVYLDTSVGSGSATWRKLSELSKGQRATALLMLLLGASNSPLLIDQPEDDLDNRFVFTEIVKKLRSLKGKRQIIASTHNANIPVLGDAELIVVLEGNGTNAWVAPKGEGSLDNPVVRGFAEDLLEGGREAFSDRQHLYGF